MEQSVAGANVQLMSMKHPAAGIESKEPAATTTTTTTSEGQVQSTTEHLYDILTIPSPLTLLAQYGPDTFVISELDKVGGGGGDPERTPINSEKSFTFNDSGTESICSESLLSPDEMSSCDDRQQLANDRILKYFAATNATATAAAAGEMALSVVVNTNSLEIDSGEEEVEDDSSTLSESSVLSPTCVEDIEEGRVTELITPESVVAAIDKKIREEVELARIEPNAATANNNGSGHNNNNNAVGGGYEHEGMFSRSMHIDTIVEEETEEFDEDNDDDDMGRGRVPLIRSTSLKTGKTPPGTPRGKKIVRFADALGLDLASVRHIVDDGCPYMPPLAAFKELKLDDEERAWLYEQTGSTGGGGNIVRVTKERKTSPPLLPPTRPTLRMLFAQPSCEPGLFMERLRTNKVCLENCLVTGPEGVAASFTIDAIVRVANIAFEKRVVLRYTTNEWLTWTDVVASYVPHSSDGFSDKFRAVFTLAVNANGHQAMLPGQRLVFALNYLANEHEEFWDNNLGLNYAIIYQRC